MILATSNAHATFGLVEIAIFLAIWLVSMFFSAKIGHKKGYNAVLFGFLGFFFGLIMLVIVTVMPYRADKQRGASTTAMS